MGRGVRRGPLADSYPGAVGLVVLSLIPYLALTAAVFPLAQQVAVGVGLSQQAFDITIALSTGAYALGTVLAVQVAVHLPARRALVVYEITFVAASILSAWAPTGIVFAIGFVTQGLCTSLMLIAAVPPLVTRWPAEKMPVTGGIMNLCIFGAVAVGPTVGAAFGVLQMWRPLFIIVACLAALALLFSLLTFEDEGAKDRDAPWDVVAVGLASVGCAAAFYGAGKLQAAGAASPEALAPLLAGFAVLVALVVHQATSRNPLMPVRSASTSVPLSGLCVALSASAAAFGMMELALEALKSSGTPGQVAIVFLPEFGGAIVVAGVFMLLFRTRFTPVLALTGLLAVLAAGVVLIVSLPSLGPGVAVAAGLLGLGVAASVSPALFMVGFSLRSSLLQRVFAMIELMRGVTAFLVAPILLFLAEVLAPHPSTGIDGSLWICVALAAGGFLGGTALFVLGKGRLEVPDLDRWQEQDEPAWRSPPLRRRHGRLRLVTPRPSDAATGVEASDGASAPEPDRRIEALSERAEEHNRRRDASHVWSEEH